MVLCRCNYSPMPLHQRRLIRAWFRAWVSKFVPLLKMEYIRHWGGGVGVVAGLLWGNKNIQFFMVVQCGAFITQSVSQKYSIKKPHSSPAWARYGVSFVGSNSDLYSTSVTAVLYVISCYIGPCYKGTWLYIDLIQQSYDINQIVVTVISKFNFCNDIASVCSAVVKQYLKTS